MMFPVIPMLYRARAREVLKKNFSTALMVSFLAALPGLLTQVYQNIASKDLLEALRYHMLTIGDAVAAGAADMELMNLMHVAGTELLSAITPMLKVAWGLTVAVALITPVLALGLSAHLLKIVRGEEGAISDVASRLGCFFKAILQNVVVWIKTMLWMLPGMALSIGAMVMFLMSDGRNDMMLYVYMLGFIASVALSIRAMLHYCMSGIVMADDPSIGVMKSISTSIKMMNGHKMDFVRVYLSFILWNIAASWASTMLGAMVPVLGTMSSLVFQLVLGLYVNTTIVVFYLNMKGEISMVPKHADFSHMDWPGREGNDEQNDKSDDDDDMLN